MKMPSNEVKLRKFQGIGHHLTGIVRGFTQYIRTIPIASHLALILVFLYLLYHFLIKPHSYWKEKGVKNVKPVPIFGNVFVNIAQKKSIAEMTKTMYDAFRNERYSGMYQLLKPVLIIHDPELIKTVTIKDFDHFTDHSTGSHEDVDPLWGRNLFAMVGESWRDMRNTLSPAFTSSKMRTMFTLINECAENFSKYYLKENQDVIKLEMKDTYTRATNDIIASCAFGIKCDSLEYPENTFYTIAKKAFNFSGLRQNLFLLYSTFPKLMKFFGWKLFSDEMSEFFRGVINETIRIREEKSIVRPDMIHLLLEAQKGSLKEESNNTIADSFASTHEFNLGKQKSKLVQFTNEDITAQALIFFLGGFDTTSYLMCFLSYELAVNPEIQEKLRNEISATWEECQGNLTYEALNGMKYLDMVICEVLRKWPPFPIMDRICTKDYTIKAIRPEEKDYNVKKNDIIIIPIFGIHRDPEYYPNPEKFDPERFAPENRVKLNSSTYFPFGSGPRNCIGSRFAILENKTIMFHMIRNFQVVPTEKTTIPMVISKKQFIISSQHGFWLGLKKIVN
ncbi:PREDICTED: cytochrome P450 9e2-like [Nicrophorus vespilloides]|uniref:Cytochrome P450 9e2-like n=1 Tax=Nicrophorus vespilloides TaxID=110193 RepID=A0ABM1M4E5_NICVS|nr:PREDICTED: cytochrome P450 9e2-like [Nicrophorus vespilloides]